MTHSQIGGQRSVDILLLIAAGVGCLLFLALFASTVRTDLLGWFPVRLILLFPFVIVPLVYLGVTKDFASTYAANVWFLEDAEVPVYFLAATMTVYVALVLERIGYGLGVGRELAVGVPAPLRWSHSRARLVVLVFSAIGAFSYYEFLRRVGGVVYYAANLSTAWVLAYPLNKYWRMGLQLWPIASLIWFADELATAGRARWSLVHLAFSAMLWVSLGNRGELINLFVSCVVIYHYLKSSVRLSLRLVVLLGVVAAAAIATTWLRFGVRSLDSLRSVMVGNYGPVGILAVLLKGFPQVFEPLGGQSLLDVLVMPIPRAWWPDKPVGIGHYLAQLFWPGAVGGPTIGVYGELYVNFLWPGIAIGAVLIGVVGRVLWEWTYRNRNSVGAVLMYSQTIFWGGELSGFFIGMLQRIVPLTIGVLLISGPRWKRARRARHVVSTRARSPVRCTSV